MGTWSNISKAVGHSNGNRSAESTLNGKNTKPFIKVDEHSPVTGSAVEAKSLFQKNSNVRPNIASVPKKRTMNKVWSVGIGSIPINIAPARGHAQRELAEIRNEGMRTNTIKPVELPQSPIQNSGESHTDETSTYTNEVDEILAKYDELPEEQRQQFEENYPSPHDMKGLLHALEISADPKGFAEENGLYFESEADKDLYAEALSVSVANGVMDSLHKCDTTKLNNLMEYCNIAGDEDMADFASFIQEYDSISDIRDAEGRAIREAALKDKIKAFAKDDILVGINEPDNSIDMLVGTPGMTLYGHSDRASSVDADLGIDNISGVESTESVEYE